MKRRMVFLVCLWLFVILAMDSHAEKITTNMYEISSASIDEIIKIDAFRELDLNLKNLQTDSIRWTFTLSGNASDLIRLNKKYLNFSFHNLNPCVSI